MNPLAAQCPWWLAGPLVGLLLIGMQWAGNLWFGATGGFVAIDAWARRPSEGPSWRAFFFLGTLGGGLLYALASGSFSPSFAQPGFDALYHASLAGKAAILMVAGVLTGYGARTAGGCTSGHMICGFSQGSPASIGSSMIFFGVAAVTAQAVTFVLGSGAMKIRLAGLGFGIVFGFWLCWTRFVDFDTIRNALMFRDFYMWFMFALALGVGAVGLRVVRRAGARTWIDGQPVGWSTQTLRREHVTGSILFGVGWALAGTCPGPIIAQVGSGRLAGLFTMAGVFVGIALRGAILRRREQQDAVPALAPTGGCA